MAVQAEHFPKASTSKKKKTIDLSASMATLQSSKNILDAPAPDMAALFGFSENSGGSGIRQVPLSSLIAYSNKELGFAEQPFQVREDNEMLELVEDIREHGILEPLLVVPQDDSYMILSGHRRRRAAEIAGLKTVPVIVKDVDSNTAAQIVVQSNLLHRERLLPSERAFAYKLRVEALKRQGKRSDLTAEADKSLKGKTALEIVGAETGDSAKQVQRYIRLTQLNRLLLDWVDARIMPVNAGVSLSYLPSPLQKLVYDLLSECDTKMTLELAEQIRNVRPLDEEAIEQLIIKPKATKKSKQNSQGGSNAKKERTVKIPYDSLAPYFDPNLTDEQIIEGIRQALAFTASHSQDLSMVAPMPS